MGCTKVSCNRDKHDITCIRIVKIYDDKNCCASHPSDPSLMNPQIRNTSQESFFLINLYIMFSIPLNLSVILLKFTLHDATILSLPHNLLLTQW